MDVVLGMETMTSTFVPDDEDSRIEFVPAPVAERRRFGTGALTALGLIGVALIALPFLLARIGVIAPLTSATVLVHTDAPGVRPNWVPAIPLETRPPDHGVFAAGTVDLARNKPVTASGHTQNFVPDNAVDGDPNTYWLGPDGGFPQSITVDLGATVMIDRLVLGVPSQPGWVARTQTVEIDGDNGTIAGPWAYNFSPASGNQVRVNLAPVATRHVRLVFTGNSEGPAAELSTFEVYGA